MNWLALGAFGGMVGLDATSFATHRFPLADTMAAYDTFAAAAESDALKVVLEATPTVESLAAREEFYVSGGI